MKFKNLGATLFFSLGVITSACVTPKEESNSTASVLKPASVSEEDLEHTASQSEAAPEVQPTEIDDSIDQELQSSANGEVPAIGSEEDEINAVLKQGIPVELNDKVERWIDFFTKKNPEAFQRFLDRGQPYQKMIVATLRDTGIPSEIYYLAMIESGFVLQARSAASAVGFWQFIPATGRRYGLRVDKFVDERRDPWRSTVAASLYLADLHNVFNSWYLAMAAYNAGEMRIMGAIMKGKSRDFWDLVRQRVLPSETMEYIPKFLAAYIIGKDPAKYGFRVPTAEAHEAIVGVNVPSPINLKKVADVTDIPHDVLMRFNPHLKSGITPADANTYKIWIPKQQQEKFREKALALNEHRLSIKQATPMLASSDKVQKYHRVKRGERLATIAQKYGLTLEQIKQINNLRSNVIYRGTRLKVRADGDATLAKASKQKSNQLSETIYKVRRGDNLQLIAKKFGLTVSELKKINKLQRNGIQIGQVLKISRAT